MMVISKKLLFSLVLGLCITGSVFAQKDQKKDPPKNPPPVITPKPKPPGKDETKPKKPGSAMVFWRTEDDSSG
jgi:hypothetical protein